MGKFIDSYIYKLIIEIVVPILSSLLGGMLAFGVAKYTISKERKLEMKPFLVIRDYAYCSLDDQTVLFNSHYWEEYSTDSESRFSYCWQGIPIQNACNNTCVIKYVILNQTKYSLDYTTVLQPNEKIIIKAKALEEENDPLSVIALKKQLSSVKLGLYDMSHHKYEYDLHFEIKDGFVKFTDIVCR